MTEPIESTELWDIYQLPDGRKINILRSEVSVALAAARFQFCLRAAQLPQAQGTVPPLAGGPTDRLCRRRPRPQPRQWTEATRPGLTAGDSKNREQ